jgi:hypothetical protein
VAYTTDDLVSAIRRDSFLPAAQAQWTTARMLEVADKCVLRRIVPAFLGIGDGFYREYTDITLVLNQAGYDIPKYAMLNKIHQAMLLGSDGVTLGRLLRKDPPDLKYWNAIGSGTPDMMRLEGDQIVLSPKPNAGALTTWPSIRVWIYRRPGRMVATTSARTIQSVVGTLVTYTSTVPSTFTSSSTHDVYRPSSPFRRAVSSAVATAAGASSQNFSAANAALMQAGDIVNVVDETCFPPCSIEVQPFLEELVIASMSATQGDRAALENSMKAIVDDMMTLVSAAANRADAMPQVASLLNSPFVRNTRRRGMGSVTS